MSAVLLFPWLHMMCFVAPIWAWLEEFLKLQENRCNCWTCAQYPPLCCLPPNFLLLILTKDWKLDMLTSFSSTSPSLPQALESAQLLCKVQGLDSRMELYRQHMGQLLDWLAASVNTWSSYSPQRLQLNIIVIQSGEKWSLNVHKTYAKLYSRCWSLHV